MKKGLLFILVIFLNASNIVYTYIANCNAGNKISCAVLGLMYYNGENVKKNKTKSVKYYKRACFLGEKNSCFKLYKIIKDKKESFYYLMKACNFNNKKACMILTQYFNNKQIETKIKILSGK